MLILKDHATRYEVINNARLTAYMKSNIASWHSFAVNTVGIECEEQDLLLIRGWTKTKEWHLAAFWETSKARSGSVGGQTSFVVGAEMVISIINKEAMEVEERSGPTERSRRLMPPPAAHVDDDSPDDGDQCIFILAFKAKRRLGSWVRKISAAAGYDRLPDPNNDVHGPGTAIAANPEGALYLETESHSGSFTVSSLLNQDDFVPLSTMIWFSSGS